MRAHEFETVPAKKILAYVKKIQGDGHFYMDRLITRYPQWHLVDMPLSRLKINPDPEIENPLGTNINVDLDYVSDITPQDIARNPIVADPSGWIIDGNHRATAAQQQGLASIPAYVPIEQNLSEGLYGVKRNVTEFLDSLTPDDVGVDIVGPYRIHYEGFNDDCQSSSDYRKNPDKVYQEVFADHIKREKGQQPVEQGMVGDEEYPILYSIFRAKALKEGKITLSTDPNWYGATVDNYKATGPVVNIPANQLVGFEPDDKMDQPKSKANVGKIVAGLKQGAKLPPLLVRQYKNGYQVLDGHHRFWAYKLLGVKSIPSQIVPPEDIEEKGKQGVAESESTKAGIVQTEVYGTKAYHAKCMQPGCDWQSKRYDRIRQAQVAAQKHAEKHVGRLDLAEGEKPGKPVVDAIRKVLPVAQEIWFHGSRATGRHGRNSDTDILVVVPDDLVGDRYLKVVRILQKLALVFDNYDIQPTKSGTNIHRIAQEEGQLLWSNQQGVAEGKDFDTCFDQACKLYDKAEHKNLEPTLVQVADFQGDGSGADPRWAKIPQHVWQHYVVIVGDTVLDPTARQFGANMPTRYPVSDLDQLWGKQYQIRPREGVEENFADGKVKGRSRPGRVKRAGASCAGSVSDLRAKARKYGGERGRMYHWCANMKGGRK